MKTNDQSISVEERFQQLLNEQSKSDNIKPVRIIFEDGKEIFVDKLIAYYTDPNEPNKHRTLVYGSFKVCNFLDAKISINKVLDKSLKIHVTKGLEHELKKAGISIDDVNVELMQIPKELMDKLKKME